MPLSSNNNLGPDDIALVINGGAFKSVGFLLNVIMPTIYAHCPAGFDRYLFQHWCNNSHDKDKIIFLNFVEHDQFHNILENNYASKLGPHSKAATVLYFDPETNQTVTNILINYDKVFLDQEGQKKEEGFVDGMITVAHELYGNALFYMQQTQEELREIAARGHRGYVERNTEATRQTVYFCRSVLKDAILPAEPLSHFRKALVNQNTLLRYWQNEMIRLDQPVRDTGKYLTIADMN